MLLDLLKVTACELQVLLSSGNLTCTTLVQKCLAQIKTHDDRLKAMISLVPSPQLMAWAQRLDSERQTGRVRSALHGIPLLVKDNINTGSDMQVDTTAGSLAFVATQPRINAEIVRRCIDAGAIIIGKANLSELAYFKSLTIPWAWSALGGQTQSAYVPSGVDPNDGIGGHSNPGGSSSGSAVGVSAGFAPLSLGTDTIGSLIIPADRAALYAMRPSVGLAPVEGILPVSTDFDTVGPMAKCVKDMAIMLDIILRPPTTFTEFLCGSWSDISVGTLDPEIWQFGPGVVKPVPEATAQMVADINLAYDKIRETAKKVCNVPLIHGPPLDEIDNLGDELLFGGFNRDLKQYLKSLDQPNVFSVTDLVKFNKEHEDIELPKGYDSQDVLEAAMNAHLTKERYQELHKKISKDLTEDGFEAILKAHDVDVIIGPSDSDIYTVFGLSGYPAVTLPLGYLDFNGRPFGLVATASKYREALLVKVASAWEASFPPRRSPPSLAEPDW